MLRKKITQPDTTMPQTKDVKGRKVKIASVSQVCWAYWDAFLYLSRVFTRQGDEKNLDIHVEKKNVMPLMSVKYRALERCKENIDSTVLIVLFHVYADSFVIA